MAHSERMIRGNFLARIEGAESLLLLPSLLPLGFDQVKRILSATACHRAVDTTQKNGGLNGGMSGSTRGRLAKPNQPQTFQRQIWFHGGNLRQLRRDQFRIT